MPDTDRIKDNINLVRTLSNEIAAFLYKLPDDVWRDPTRFASGCKNWNVSDVISHLIDQANHTTLSIERAFKGITAPLLGYKKVTPSEANQRLFELRETFYEDLFPEFNTSCLRLNNLFMELTSDQYEHDAWHASGIRSVDRLIQYRILELAIHGWDIRYSFDRSTSLNQPVVPFLLTFLNTWLASAFKGSKNLLSPVKFNFELNGAKSYSLCVMSDRFILKSSNVTSFDIALKFTHSEFILFLTGRLPIKRLARRGYIQVIGDIELAFQLSEWFGPVHLSDLT